MTFSATVSPRARVTYIALSSLRYSFSTASSHASSSSYHPSDFQGQPFTGSYEPGLPTSGPLGDTSNFGVPRLTPKMLKQHLDQFVVGQERPKRVLSVAVYNHYQRIQELQRQQEEQEELTKQRERRMKADRHPVEDEYPGQESTMFHPGHEQSSRDSRLGSSPLQDYSPLTVDKSNILMLGPSGVGKTLMAKTLARILEVPFSMSDCTPFTQAGYIGEDVDVCVARLLSAADYDVARAEHGIICLDEIDKIATAKVSHGKDVSGEGVQQALLKIIEGTTLQITAKQERNAPGKGGNTPGGHGSVHTGGPLGSPGQGPGSGGGAKGDIYNVRTDNILFICTGAFINLHQIILDRISKGSIGFGQPIRSTSSVLNSASSNGKSSALYNMKDEQALYKKHLPFFTSNEEGAETYNPLDLVEPADLQKYGLIPELVGRIPVSTALNALDEEALIRVLTEPRNSLLKQYEQIFQFSGVELRFTSGALREVAKAALNMNTGARGLRTVMERLLSDAMFDAPGSSIKHILITTAVAQKKTAPIYLARGQSHKFHAMIAQEEEEWESKQQKEQGNRGRDGVSSFEEYREQGRASGVV